MSQSEPSPGPTSDAPGTRGTSAATRVDTAHTHTPEATSSAAALEHASAASFAISASGAEPSAAASTVQQVRTQAAQLATHLQREQASIDHRESELNARLAAMENQVRSARLWLNERQEELARKQAELESRQRELDAREAALSGGPNNPQKKPKASPSPSAAGGEHGEMQAELDRRETELYELADRMADQLALAEKTQEAKQLLRTIETRRVQLERAEQQLGAEHAALERQQRQLADDRSAFAEQTQMDRKKMSDEQQSARAELDKTRRDIERQTDEMTSRQAVLERLRSEVARSQQEALETRLATEELWSRLCDAMPPAALTQSLAQIRLKLADEQRIVRAELAAQKAEVLALSARLAEEHEKFSQQRDDLQAWAHERQKDLEKQAGVLIAEQQAMEDDRAFFKESSEQWQNERFRLQQEIRHLARQLNRGESVTV